MHSHSEVRKRKCVGRLTIVHSHLEVDIFVPQRGSRVDNSVSVERTLPLYSYIHTTISITMVPYPIHTSVVNSVSVDKLTIVYHTTRLITMVTHTE